MPNEGLWFKDSNLKCDASSQEMVFLREAHLSSRKAPLALNLGLSAAELRVQQCGCGCDYMGSAVITVGLPVLLSSWYQHLPALV